LEQIQKTIRAAFPEHPVPDVFFSSVERWQNDLQKELSSRIEGRIWTSLSLLDWRMIGATPAAYREYLAPQAFAYYAPSFLIGASSESEFLYLALEAILPSNQDHKPRGDWWFSFSAAFTSAQRAAVQAFLAAQRDTGRSLDMVDEELISSAERVWF
jgi:hypothetical protein